MHADLGPTLRANIAREARLMTDKAAGYKIAGKEFASHDTADHSKDEYVRYADGIFTFPEDEPYPVITTNTVEGYYSFFKRGMKGVYPLGR
jgi:ISXO2-like transposase domain